MPISLRIPQEKDNMIKNAAMKTGKTKTAFIIEAVDEKLGLIKNREQTIRELAGWLSHNDTKQLRETIEHFNQVNEGDWD